MQAIAPGLPLSCSVFVFLMRLKKKKKKREDFPGVITLESNQK